jgi:hypothetical protein
MLGRLQYWRQWASELPPNGSVSLWGAGSKGVMFLNLLGLVAPGKITWAIDQNADKHGRFLSGTAQQVMGPGALREREMNQIVLMNGIYETEVRTRLAGLRAVPPALNIAWP